MAEYMGVVWLIAVIGFTVLEASTVQFVSLWFAGGALVSLIMFVLGASLSWQIIGFAVSSLLLLILTRPFVRKMTKNTENKTNSDALIGRKTVIIKETDSFGDGGEAKIDGKIWTVKSSDGAVLMPEEIVVIEKIEGVKLIVRK